MITPEQILASVDARYLKNETLITARDSSDEIKILPQFRSCGKDQVEYSAVITNYSGEPVFLKDVTLFSCGAPETLGMGPAPYECFRSGRHKNDMPGVFTIGRLDERLKDVLSQMSETGEQVVESGTACVVSDHLSIIHSQDNHNFFIEFLTGREQLFETTFFLDADANCTKITAKTIFNIRLEPGETVSTEVIRLAETENVKDEIDYFCRYKTGLYGSRAGKHPSVFCTWYYYGLTVTYEDVRMNLARVRELNLPFDVFQVDEGWEIVLGEWAPNQKFPVPMKQVADEIKAAGYIPGIWTSPFVAHETASVWKDHPEWILKDKQGNPCLFPMNDTVYFVFDITNPATYEYFTRLYQKLTDEWGYTYHKLDFTRAAVIYEDAVFYDDRVTLAQAFYRAVQAIRKGMGEESFFVMCGGLYDPVIGLVDAQRTGSDVLSMWSSNINKDGKTAPYTIRQSVMRYYMNAWWDNDPDALMIRKNEQMERNLRLTYGLLNDDEVKSSVVNQFMGGGIMCATEPLDKITPDRLYEIRRILPVVKNVSVAPVNLFDGKRFPGAVTVDAVNPKTARRVRCICIINWSDEEPMELSLALEKYLPEKEPDARYVVSDYYSGDYICDADASQTVTFHALAPHAAAVVKIEKQEGLPVVVASNAHYSMGCELERFEIVNNTLYFQVCNPYPVDFLYKVWLPAGYTVEESRILEITAECTGKGETACLKTFLLQSR